MGPCPGASARREREIILVESPSSSTPYLSSWLLSPLSIATIDGAVAVVADNPPEKKLDGMRDERGRGHGINVMSDSALGPPPPPAPIQSWRDTRRVGSAVTPANIGPGGGLASLSRRHSDFKMTPSCRHDLMIAPCAPVLPP